MSKQSRNLENLSQELSETVKRIDKLQERPPLRRRVVNHFSRQGSHIVGVVLAGTLFSVALDRLAQKRYYEAEREKWQEEQSSLGAEKLRLEEQLHEAQRGRESLQKLVEEELNRGQSWWNPLPKRLQQGLADIKDKSMTTPPLVETPAAGQISESDEAEPQKKGKPKPDIMI